MQVRSLPKFLLLIFHKLLNMMHGGVHGGFQKTGLRKGCQEAWIYQE
ncbi:hypothetical protein KSS87_013045 [Heliosperma pusillum]|nr:hypothetical protein KSS87_013045 [Heliosperma pusillum]